MLTKTKESQLNIRTTLAEKEILAKAARIRKVSTSQFVLNQSLEAAEEVLAEERFLRVDSQEHAWLMAKLEEPPKELPRLRELFSRPSVFES